MAACLRKYTEHGQYFYFMGFQNSGKGLGEDCIQLLMPGGQYNPGHPRIPFGGYMCTSVENVSLERGYKYQYQNKFLVHIKTMKQDIPFYDRKSYNLEISSKMNLLLDTMANILVSGESSPEFPVVNRGIYIIPF
jgi:hypothetical protein